MTREELLDCGIGSISSVSVHSQCEVDDGTERGKDEASIIRGFYVKLAHATNTRAYLRLAIAIVNQYLDDDACALSVDSNGVVNIALVDTKPLPARYIKMLARD